MQPLTIFWRTLMVGSILLLAACAPAQTPVPTVDTAEIFTQVAQTLAVQFTQTSQMQTALAPAATNTLVPTQPPPATFTPVALASPNPLAFSTQTPTLSLGLPPVSTPTGPLCNNSILIRDIGTPDGAVLKPGQKFEKGWVVQNTGICTWGIGYALVLVGGNTNFSAAPFAIRGPQQYVQSGAFVEISLKMIAPKQLGLFEAYYQMYSENNSPFGTGMTIRIEVRR